ncbi:MAG: endonuclease [Isosphaeraceae bacterium]|nr:endonuclease [Isosphaeraceae bacterium]
MAAPSKAQLLTEVHALLKKRYKLEPRAERMSVLEAVIYGICHEGTTREQANQALSRFKDDFFDWNEVRVSSLAEIQGVLAGLPDPEGRAFRIRRFLRQLFDRTYGFTTLEDLVKKPQKEATKVLQEYEALQSDYVLATVIQQALGGHAIPIDAPMRRGLERLGVAEPGMDDASLRATLERAVPKNRGAEFVDLMEELVHDTCIEGEPDCPRCELRKICPTGQERLASERAAAKAVTAAPAKSPREKPKPAPDGESPARSRLPKVKEAPGAASAAKAPKAPKGKPPKAK